MKTTLGKYFSQESTGMASGLATWLAVASLSLYQSYAYSPESFLLILAGHLLILIGILAAINESSYPGEFAIRYLALLIQFGALVWLWWVQNNGYIAIYSVMLIGQLNYYMTARWCGFYTLVSMSIFYTIRTYHWGNDYALTDTILFTVFHFFSWAVSYRTNSESAAKEEAIRSRQALLATQQLLADSSKQTERLRIARELHDAVGHQLTGLVINLEVAKLELEVGGVNSEKVESCQQLAKLLLEDIRQVVSEYRDESSIDLSKAIRTIAANTPKLKIELRQSDTIIMNDAELANSVLRIIQECITNTLKHSHASSMCIEVKSRCGYLSIGIKDDGFLNKPIIKGNGLIGIEERVSQHSGELTLDVTSRALRVSIKIPLEK